MKVVFCEVLDVCAVFNGIDTVLGEEWQIDDYIIYTGWEGCGKASEQINELG